MAVIVTGGLAGGGGRFLGPELSRRIDADYVDRLILSNVARELQATVEALDQREQRPPTRAERFARIVQRIMQRTAYTGGGPDPYFGTVYPEFLVSEYDELPNLIATRGHEIRRRRVHRRGALCHRRSGHRGQRRHRGPGCAHHPEGQPQRAARWTRRLVRRSGRARHGAREDGAIRSRDLDHGKGRGAHPVLPQILRHRGPGRRRALPTSLSTPAR